MPCSAQGMAARYFCVTESAAISIVVPAAGAGSRLGQNKPLVQLTDGQSLLQYQLRKLTGLACNVVVVTGFEADRLDRSLQSASGLPHELTTVHNRGWQQGLGSSISLAIGALPAGIDAALVLLADQWQVSSADLSRLIKLWRTSPETMACASYDGRLGCPVIFPRSRFKQLQQLRGDRGARDLIRGESGKHLTLEMPTAAFDLDTEADLHAARMQLLGLQPASG